MTIEFIIANKTHKKAIKRFYKTNHYSASFIGNDVCLLARIEQQIVAAVIVSQVNSSYWLHALVVAPNYRAQGIARQLTNALQTTYRTLYCFASKKLEPFYLRLGFGQINPHELPEELTSRYLSYLSTKQQLLAFKYQH